MTPEPGVASSPARARVQAVKQRAKHAFKEFVVMFLYLWVTFGLFALHQAILMAEQGHHFRLQGFAIINALVLAKVMLIAEDLHLARGRQDSRPILVILNKSLAFGLLFIIFHILESIIVGVVSGKTIAASFPELGGGSLQGIVSLGIIISVSLMPFFAFREVSRAMGEDRLLRLIMERGGPDASAPASTGD
jgi:hypothetical protein